MPSQKYALSVLIRVRGEWMGYDGSVDSGGGNWNECIIEFWVSCRAINWASETFSNIHHSRHHRLLLLVVPVARKHKPEDGNRTRGRGGAAGGSSSEQADRSRYSVNCSVVELWVDEILSDWFKIEAIRFITLNTSEAVRNCWCWDGQAFRGTTVLQRISLCLDRLYYY